VSILNGGFDECHRTILKNQLYILNHDKDNCLLCMNEIKRSDNKLQDKTIAKSLYSGFRTMYDRAENRLKQMMASPNVRQSETPSIDAVKEI
jgi:hypothetical protein